MIEIVERATCPTCGGTGNIDGPGEFIRGELGYKWVSTRCQECNVTGTVPRVLATFADAAALHRAMAAGIRRGQWVHWGTHVPDGDETLTSLSDGAVAGYVWIAGDVLAALGVSDDQG